MNSLTSFGIRKSRLTIMIMVGLIFLGVQTYLGLPKREDPAITIRDAIVVAQFPGMTPERAEELIAVPLERTAREISEIDKISTLVTTGQVELSLRVHDSVGADKLEPTFQDLRNRMADMQGQLPEGTIGPIVNTDFGDVTIATIAVTGEGFSPAELWDAAEDLQAQLYRLSGITKVTLEGRQEERIWLELDARKLAAVGLQLEQVLQDLRAQNVILPAGQMDVDGVTILLEANGELETVEEVEGVFTQVPGLSGLVRLRDLLTVRRGYADPPEAPIFFNGEPALILGVEMAEDRDIQDIGRDLHRQLPLFEQDQPIGISYSLSTFQEANVTQAINAALVNVGQTFLVVAGALALFLGLRPALVIACIVPFTVMFALIAMAQLGIDLQQISIAAVIVSLGLLVDNGLVVVEEIQKRLSNGATPHEAAEGSGRQFFLPLAVASATTVSAFIPMLVLEGTEGEYAYSLGAVVAVMLLGSWITALYILPFVAVHVLRRPCKDAQNDGWLVRGYGNVLRRVMRWGVGIAVVCYAIVVWAATLFGSLDGEMFPLSERAEYLIYLEMPRGTAVDATMDEALAVDAWLKDKAINPDVTDVTLFVASGGPRFYLTLDPAEGDPANAFFVVNTTDHEAAAIAAERAQSYLLTERAAARYRVTRLAIGAEEPGRVDVKLRGPDADTLLKLARQVEAAFAETPGNILAQNNWGNKSLRVTVDIAQDKAREFGVTSSDISDAMDLFFSGIPYSTFREGDDLIPMIVRAQTAFRDSFEDLENLTIPVGSGFIALDQVARFQPHFELSQIRRENQVRQVTVSGKSIGMTAGALQANMGKALADLPLPRGYSLSLGGETEQSAEVNGKLMAGIPIALIVMLAALMYQFNSARRVSLTFLTIPLVLIGAPIGLLLTSQPLSFFAILGLISLMGIIINNAIVLIDQIDIERRTRELDDAIIEAAQKRITPVMLTSLTTILGLTPMALNGGALFEPMATLMIGGLAVASPLTLFLVPTLYRAMFLWEESRA
ncbi:efflux RND transporter permease subunit [Shimia sediminis]|uniref:efflux RND transporter permease subunit n=1 Tax=Shimia sediminis TaxID=2497945 RepID=UPI000F8DF9F7|nr:efflux RND transporter permease subunit [Shimia sediminis]